MNKNLLKTVTFLAGGLSLIVGGLLYVLITDVYLLNTSTWLFLAIFPSLGSGIGFILADNIKKKVFLRYFVKGLCIALGIAFIIVLINYYAQFNLTSTSYNDLVVASVRSSKKITTNEVVSIAKVATIISLSFGFLGTILEATNTVFDIVFGIDD